MTRLSGIQLLAASIVLWALAVWIFGTPLPAETGTEAATETTVRAPDEETEEPGTAANESGGADAATVPGSAVAANQGAIGPSESDTETGDSPAQAASERTGAETVAAGTRAQAGRDPATGTTTAPAAAGADSLAAIPIRPGDSATGSIGDRAGAPGAPPRPRLGLPPSPPPPRPGYPTAEDDAVATQLAAGRRAAWEGRYADALAHYRAAARLRPDHYVVWGEMGNVLWTMRRWPEAAYALEGAATLLVRAGELRAASELVPAVGRIDREAAYRIQQLLWAATQRQSG